MAAMTFSLSAKPMPLMLPSVSGAICSMIWWTVFLPDRLSPLMPMIWMMSS
jgi:hypothetical protein